MSGADVDGALSALRAGIIARLANRLGCHVSRGMVQELMPGRNDAEVLSETIARFRRRGFVRRLLRLLERGRLG